MKVLGKWFGHRRRNPAGKRRLELDYVVVQRRLPVWTAELWELLNVLGLIVREEPAQAAILDDVGAGPLIPVSGLTTAGIFPVPAKAAEPLNAASDAGAALFERRAKYRSADGEEPFLFRGIRAVRPRRRPGPPGG
jgi:hypothetical protein